MGDTKFYIIHVGQWGLKDPVLRGHQPTVGRVQSLGKSQMDLNAFWKLELSTNFVIYWNKFESVSTIPEIIS